MLVFQKLKCSQILVIPIISSNPLKNLSISRRKRFRLIWTSSHTPPHRPRLSLLKWAEREDKVVQEEKKKPMMQAQLEERINQQQEVEFKLPDKENHRVPRKYSTPSNQTSTTSPSSMTNLTTQGVNLFKRRNPLTPKYHNNNHKHQNPITAIMQD